MKNANDWIVAGVTALVTAVIVVGLAQSAPVNANSPFGHLTLDDVNSFSLKANDCNVRVAERKPSVVAAGSSPTFELVLSNPGDEAKSCTFTLELTKTPKVSQFSRMLALPEKVGTKKI